MSDEDDFLVIGDIDSAFPFPRKSSVTKKNSASSRGPRKDKDSPPRLEDRIVRSKELWDPSYVDRELLRRTKDRRGQSMCTSTPSGAMSPRGRVATSPRQSREKDTGAAKALSPGSEKRRPPQKKKAAAYMETAVVHDDDDEDEANESSRDEREEYIVCVLGGGGAGKSSLIVRLLTGEFVDEVDPTLLDEYQGIIEFQGRRVHCHFLDTAGQEQYREHRYDSITRSQAYLLVYDVCQPVSFEEIDVFVNEICRLRGCDSVGIPIVIAANKSDAPEERKKISGEEGRAFAAENSCRFVEVSAKSQYNLTRLIEVVLQEIAFYRRKRQATWVVTSDNSLKGARKRYLVLDRDRMFLLKKQLKDAAPTPDFMKEEAYQLCDFAPHMRTGQAQGPKGDDIFILSISFLEDFGHEPIVFQFKAKKERDLWYNRLRSSYESATLKE